MSEKKIFTLENLLIVGAVVVGIVVLLRLVLARSRPVVQQAQTNPLVALIDAAPALVNATSNFISSIWTREDGESSGVDHYKRNLHTDQGNIDLDFVDSLPVLP
jgi:hypothetical protein